MANRKAPMARLLAKLGLGQFRNVGPLRAKLLPAAKVGIKLKQHLGAPCEPVVNVGDHVSKGQVVGRPPQSGGKPALGAPVHASIDGTVTDTSGGVVWIQGS
jgi:Na+-translocating ferredoxin:NAD+ oxidoreductase RnfC subunit